MIVTKTRDQIEKHEDWYRNYLSLNELKKKAIQEWKEKKKVRIFSFSHSNSYQFVIFIFKF